MDLSINQPSLILTRLQNGSPLHPRQYPSETAFPRPRRKSNASIADYEGITASNVTPPTTAVPRATVASPPGRTQTSTESAKPATRLTDAAAAPKADLPAFSSPLMGRPGSLSPKTTSTIGSRSLTNHPVTASSFAPTLLLRCAPPHIGTASNYRPPPLPS